MIDQRRLHPRLVETDLDSPPFVPELSPVVHPHGDALMTRPWLDWARRLTLLVGVNIGSGGGGGTGTGDVVGPASATADAIAIYSGVTGKLIKDSLTTIASVISQAVSQAIASILPGGKLPVGNLPLHHTLHQAGGVDAVDVKLLAGYPGGTTNFLRSDGAFAAPTAVAGPHHATHEIGGTDVIANNAWTNQANTFTQRQGISLAAPSLLLDDTSQPPNVKKFALTNYGQLLQIQAVDDVGGSTTPVTIDRAGGIITQGNLTANAVNASAAGFVFAPTYYVNEGTTAPAGSRRWQLLPYAGTLYLQTQDDTGGSGTNVVNIGRTGHISTVGAYYEQSRSLPQGYGYAEPYNPANFIGYSGGTWQVDAGDYRYLRYSIVGKTMTIAWQFVATTLTVGPVGELRMPVPGGYSASFAIATPTYINTAAGGMEFGLMFVTGAVMSFQRFQNAAWVVGDITLNGQVAIELS